MDLPDTLVLRQPDDWHLHLRDGLALKMVLPYTAQRFGRAIIMPNLTPPVTTFMAADAYKGRILSALAVQGFPVGVFKPLMTIYLTDTTSTEDIHLAKECGSVFAAKLYPANATTNSAHGVTDIKRLAPVFKKMEEVGLVLSVHGETLISKAFGDATRNGRVGQLRREAVFLKETMEWLVNTFPGLKIVLEHITTKQSVAFVRSVPSGVGATITAHHLLATLDDALVSHHNKCMPVLKEEHHRQALLDAATSGDPRFFFGSDSAPHAKSAKETACGCAGCFTAFHAIELVATAFEQRNALNSLESFLSRFGADFYGFPLNSRTITLQRETWTIPHELPFGEAELIVPFWAGEQLHWKVV
jgi:dihydroorotase